MMKNLYALPLLFAIGCGIDGKPLAEIDADLWQKICDKATADLEPLVCGDVEIPAATSAQCVEANAGNYDAACTTTFASWRECQDFEFSDPCAPDLSELPQACTDVANCYAAAE